MSIFTVTLNETVSFGTKFSRLAVTPDEYKLQRKLGSFGREYIHFSDIPSVNGLEESVWQRMEQEGKLSLNEKYSVGVIGAQGSFGRQVVAKLRDLSGDIEVSATVDKNHNKEIALASDIILLAVRPPQVKEVLQEIRESWSNTHIVSLAAGVPLAYLADARGTPIRRAMMDPTATVGILTARYAEGLVVKFLRTLLRTPLKITTRDEEVDRFTVALSFLHVTCNWAFARRSDTDSWIAPHLQFISETPLGLREVAPRIFEQIRQHEAHDDRLSSYCTHGGISALLVKTLEANATIEPNELFQNGLDRVRSIQDQLP